MNILKRIKKRILKEHEYCYHDSEDRITAYMSLERGIDCALLASEEEYEKIIEPLIAKLYHLDLIVTNSLKVDTISPSTGKLIKSEITETLNNYKKAIE